MEYLEFIPQNDDIDLERIRRLRARMQNRQASLCTERAMCYTRSFQETEGEDWLLRKAKAFARTLKEMTIWIDKDSLIFGCQASRNFAAPVFPEYSIDWVIDELETFSLRDGDVFQVSEEDKARLRSIQSYWHGHTHEDQVRRATPERIVQAEQQKVLHRGGISMSGDGHIVPDHEMILSRGFRDLARECRERMAAAETGHTRAFYEAAAITLEAALDWIKRFGVLAGSLAEEVDDPKRAAELRSMQVMAQSLLEEPAQNFEEALQTVYLVHVLQMIESNGHSFCYGRFDQYLWPYLQTDLERGRITKEKALERITHMFLMNSSCNKVRPYGHTRYSQGYPLYSNLMIGGRRPDGEDGTNPLSYLCLEAMNLTAMAEPNFSMRYSKDTPDDLLRLAARLIATGCGMPSMFYDDVAAKAIHDLGIPWEDALDYCAIGCVETGVPGKYGHRATGMTYVNWGKILELLLHGGCDPDSGTCLCPVPEEFGSYEELWSSWNTLLKFYTDLAVECDAVCDRSLERYDASPFASVFIRDCLEKGKTAKEGGCRYDVVSQSNIGPAVVGNSLYALKKLVFDDRELTLAQVREAMDDNWQSPESARIRALCLEVPKFGNDDDAVDAVVKDVFESYLALLPDYATIRKDRGPAVSAYAMSTSNITSYVPNGKDTGATPDGRTAHSPLNEGCSPTQGTDITGPTAVIRSVAKLPNDRVAAGQLLNMRFSPDSLKTEENLLRFTGFLKASRRLGIYHNQFNVVDSATLRQAMEEPDRYRNLIVRVAGYCAQFVSLMPETQLAIIDRTENCLQ
ncbi:glycyl radical protein [Faecalibaculum rodentium]|uniref:glycyl radical protein n=2 Tax=Faecalibaculum rodentium TaxID=1702221 RepID=UPI002572572D|nr:formate C-acetyltransferase/glycerol dehydratase family glycyl radical enzyme [Faecalibaculum rodentium]